MEDVFSSKSLDTIQKKIEIEEKPLNEKIEENLEFYFDVDKIAIWVKENEFKRVIFKI